MSELHLGVVGQPHNCEIWLQQNTHLTTPNHIQQSWGGVSHPDVIFPLIIWEPVQYFCISTFSKYLSGYLKDILPP